MAYPVRSVDKGMRWAETQIIPPRAEPMHLVEARKHLRLTEADPTDEDDLIEAWIASAREVVEDVTGRQLVLATWELSLDRFPCGYELNLPHPPLREIVSITYTDERGDEAEMSLSDVIVDTQSEPGRIVLKSGKSWPSTTLQRASGVRVRYKAGFAVPFTAAVTGDDEQIGDTLTAIDHPLTENERVRLWNSGGALPAGLLLDTDYFVVDLNGDSFKLALSPGDEAATFTGAGEGIHFIGLVPSNYRAAMKLTLGSRFEHREDVIVGTNANELPQSAMSLLWARRVWYSGPAGVR